MKMKLTLRFVIVRLLGILAFVSPVLLIISCESEQVQVATCNELFSISLDGSELSDCGGATGSIAVSATNGNGTVRFKVNNGPFFDNGEFGSLAAGLYTITAVDENNCEATLSVDLLNDTDLQVSATATDVSGCGEDGGRIEVSATGGGAGPYTFSILGLSNVQSGGAFENLPQGNYTVQVEDGEGCISFQQVSVQSGVSLSGEVNNIIQSNCALSGCHVAGGRSPDLSQKTNILQNAQRIKTRTGNGSMPPSTASSSLTDGEIQTIACWVDDDAQDN